MKFWTLVVKTLKQKNNQAVAEKVVKITESTTNIKSPSYPDLNKYRVNPSGKRYDDTYITGVGYKLREILLLVWWGRTKNPRKPTSKPPRYFFYDYHLNTKKTTDMFIRDGLLKKNKEGCITLTLSGKVLYDEYKILWEIHSYKGYIGELPNMDRVFHGWNYNSYKANNNLLEIRHLEDIVKYNTIMRDQYKKGSNEYNAFQQDIEQDKNQIALLFNEHQLLENIDN
ncbi:TPA: hypothetical protein VER74_000899 [Streptococcus pyogenes]|nr:hypothetical protein [Streptococcus pyogenes]